MLQKKSYTCIKDKKKKKILDSILSHSFVHFRSQILVVYLSFFIYLKILF